ncbi:hypothetical protein D9756_004583 [Leucocoprinus leucothites]|uniref:Acetyl-CoA synthetase-like protein n=1 Tax=Leucocoprinus leucothites TaxID=201217 RepID=A0A8H5G8U7_9AGAR|nr:hypothetical protein D9756_004583 [Leucoagaricus leucothites]
MTVAQFMLDFEHEIRPSLEDDHRCFIDSKTGRELTISQLRLHTNALASALHSNYGIGDNDTVMLFSPNHIDYPLTAWAIHRLGGIVTCSNPQFTADELCHQLQVANVTFMIVHSTVLSVSLEAAQLSGLPDDRIVLLDDSESISVSDSTHTASAYKTIPGLIAQELDRSSPFAGRTLKPGEGKTKVALLFWSSGTTGTPKAVAISHYALIANVIQTGLHCGIGKKYSSSDTIFQPGDTALAVLPFYHAAGFVITVHAIIFCSMTLVVPPKYEFFDMLKNLERHRVSHLLLHMAAQGAAPVSPQMQARLCALLPKINYYILMLRPGMTEMTAVITMLAAEQQHGPLGSSGRLLPGIEARILRPDGTLAAPGEPGELIVRGPATALGYWRNKSATNETFVDGWVRTGDQVILTADNEVLVQDRLKEFLKVKGFQVAPAELEGTLLGHPDVLDCCVVGIQDERRGEAPLAYVVLSPEARDKIQNNPRASLEAEESIKKYISERKVRYKHLVGGVRFIEAIPRNGSGKILRRVLRQQAREEGTKRQQPSRSKL